MKDSIYVPSGEASAILSQLASSRLDLPRHIGLNDHPDKYYKAVIRSDFLGLLDHPAVRRRLEVFADYGVAAAMSGASSLDRVASVTENSGYIESRPPRPEGHAPSGRPEDLGVVFQSEDTTVYDDGVIIQRGHRCHGSEIPVTSSIRDTNRE